MLTKVLHLFLFHPSSVEDAHVERIGTRVRYRASDGVELASWWIPATAPRRRTVVYFHGNAATASDCWWWAQELAAEGADVLLAEYRGYGQSAGTPSARGIGLDAEAAIRYLREERGVPMRELVVHGQSLGGAAAMVALSGPASDAAGGVLESTFTSLHDMARAVVGLPLSRIVRDAYALDSATAAPLVRAPILHLHGEADEVIPFALGEALDRLLPHSTFLRIAGGTHNLVDENARREIRKFVAERVP